MNKTHKPYTKRKNTKFNKYNAAMVAQYQNQLDKQVRGKNPVKRLVNTISGSQPKIAW